MSRIAGPRPSRLRAADALRALATVLVIVIHTSHWPPGAPLYNDLDLLSRLAVPAFMMLTGVLLSYQYRGRRPDPRTFLTRRFARSLLPWLAWAPVYALTGWLLTGDVPHSAGGLLTFFSYGAGHLWFLLLIPQMYLLYLVWPRRHLWQWAALAVAVQTGLAVYRLYGPMPIAALSQLTMWHGFQILPFWFGYFAIGLAAGRELVNRGVPRPRARVIVGAALATAVSGVLLIAVTYNGAPHSDFQQGTGGFLLPQEPLLVISVAVLVLFGGPAVLRRSRALTATTNLLSQNSLGIYILHPILIYLIASPIRTALLLPGLPISMAGFLLLTVGGLAAATLVAVLLRATPLAPTLGVRRRRLTLPWVAAASTGPAAG
jgi:surface polysaccharide O-acyltransferase-like enzyme